MYFLCKRIVIKNMFSKNMDKWDIIGGIGLLNIHRYFRGLMVKLIDLQILGRHTHMDKAMHE